MTQASLLNAAKEGSKPSAAKKAAAKKEEELKLTAAEKKLVELYRAADKNTKETALKVLKGEKTGADGVLGSIRAGLPCHELSFRALQACFPARNKQARHRAKPG